MTSDHIQQRIVLLLSDVHQAARAGNWQAVRQKTEQVLHLNPFNHDARAHWVLAKNGGIDPNDTVETRIADHLVTARIALEAGDWETVSNECRLVLDLNDKNAEAESYLRTAEELITAETSTNGSRKKQPAAQTGAALSVELKPNSQYAFIENGGLSTILAGLIGAISLFHLLAGVFYLWGASTVSGLDSGESTLNEARTFDDQATIVSTLLVIGFVAGTVLFFLWLYRQVSSTRAIGLGTVSPPGVGVLVGLVFGMLGSYVILRDVAARVRPQMSVAGEFIALVWVIAGIAGIGLGSSVIREPANNAQWADLLNQAAYSSFLLAASGLCLAYLIRQTHQLLVERYVRPQTERQAEQHTRVAA